MEPFEPSWLSLLPPLAAIFLALVAREVVVSLFAGIWLGALMLTGWHPLDATLRAVDTYALGALAKDADHVTIVLFSLLLGGMVGVMGRSGGTLGIVEAVAGAATTRRRGQLLTWLAGLVIFFDDYANTLLVGSTMRPITDRLRISREKLAYIVDSTAAPVAVIALATTWVGFEISLISESLEASAAQVADASAKAGLLAASHNAFVVLVHSLPYLFYPVFALLLVLLVAATGRDIGPMLRAERRAAAGGGLLAPGATPAADTSLAAAAPPDVPRRALNAALPVASVIAAALAGMYATGAAKLGPGSHSLREIAGAADPLRSILWAAFAGCAVAILLPIAQRILTVGQAIQAWLAGLRSMLLAMIILTLAWALGDVTEALGTGPFLARALQGTLPLWSLPPLVVLVAAAISFATGTSWGTMAILFPVVVPLTVALGAGASLDGHGYSILLGVISSIMGGSIFGDHCSPISDTTVLSSMASECDHIDHVRTQLPYALLGITVSLLVGDIPTALGLHPAISLVVGTAVLYAALRMFGRRPEELPAAQEPALAARADAAPGV